MQKAWIKLALVTGGAFAVFLAVSELLRKIQETISPSDNTPESSENEIDDEGEQQVGEPDIEPGMAGISDEQSQMEGLPETSETAQSTPMSTPQITPMSTPQITPYGTPSAHHRSMKPGFEAAPITVLGTPTEGDFMLSQHSSGETGFYEGEGYPSPQPGNLADPILTKFHVDALSISPEPHHRKRKKKRRKKKRTEKKEFKIDTEISHLFEELNIDGSHLIKFAKEEIRIEDLPELSEDEVKALLPQIGPRIRLWHYIKKLRSHPPSRADSPRSAAEKQLKADDVCTVRNFLPRIHEEYPTIDEDIAESLSAFYPEYQEHLKETKIDIFETMSHCINSIDDEVLEMKTPSSMVDVPSPHCRRHQSSCRMHQSSTIPHTKTVPAGSTSATNTIPCLPSVALVKHISESLDVALKLHFGVQYTPKVRESIQNVARHYLKMMYSVPKVIDKYAPLLQFLQENGLRQGQGGLGSSTLPENECVLEEIQQEGFGGTLDDMLSTGLSASNRDLLNTALGDDFESENGRPSPVV